MFTDESLIDNLIRSYIRQRTLFLKGLIDNEFHEEKLNELKKTAKAIYDFCSNKKLKLDVVLKKQYRDIFENVCATIHALPEGVLYQGQEHPFLEKLPEKFKADLHPVMPRTKRERWIEKACERFSEDFAGARPWEISAIGCEESLFKGFLSQAYTRAHDFLFHQKQKQSVKNTQWLLTGLTGVMTTLFSHTADIPEIMVLTLLISYSSQFFSHYSVEEDEAEPLSMEAIIHLAEERGVAGLGTLMEIISEKSDAVFDQMIYSDLFETLMTNLGSAAFFIGLNAMGPSFASLGLSVAVVTSAGKLFDRFKDFIGLSKTPEAVFDDFERSGTRLVIHAGSAKEMLRNRLG